MEFKFNRSMKEIIDRIKLGLTGELPGELAHSEMAPIDRPTAIEARQWPETKESGVLILLYPYKNSVFTSLMLRPDYQGVHSNQVSFPGGRKEEFDKDIYATALREANDELGIMSNEVHVIGNLSELYIPPSKSLVTPIIGYAEKRPEFVIDPKEVSKIIEADLLDLLDEKNMGQTEIVRASYLLKRVPAILYKEFTIWGATAMIINELKWIYKKN
ncbi:MAG TPA: CoA pyrophosphatase [Ignavibacteriaceae bacterium]